MFKNSSELIDAVDAADPTRVRQALASGAEPRSRDKNGWSALHIAACRGSDEIVAALLEAGADVDAVAPTYEVIDRTGYEGTATPLMMALRNSQENTALLLLERGASLAHDDVFSGENALFIAAQKGMSKLVARLLHGGKPTSRGMTQQSPVTAALLGNHIEVASLLLDNGYAADAGALEAACCRGLLAILPLLVASGANVNGSETGSNPVAAAARHGQLATLEWLAAHGADLPALGSKAMPGAGGSGQVEALRWLITHGADVDATTHYGWTALTSAAWAGHVECVGLLLELGADDQISDVHGKTAFDWAKEGSREDVVRALTAWRSAANSV